MMNIKKQVWAVLLSIALVVTAITYPQVVAEAEENLIVYEERTDVSTYRGDTKTAPTKAGYVFAGWYASDNETSPLGEAAADSASTAYAKFVSEKVLSMKGQVTSGTTVNSGITDLRMVTTVDSLKYSEVGFLLGVNGKEVPVTSKTVYETIIGYTSDGVNAYTPSGAFACEASKYFMTYSITEIVKSYFATDFTVTPIWKTLDGTTVKGVAREFVVYDFIEGKESVYGTGIAVLPEMRNEAAVFTVKDVVITEGENVGKTYVRLDRTGNGGYHDLTISAKSEAGLLANTEYTVKVAVACDGGNQPAYYEQHGDQYDFMFDQAGGNIVFTITTDGNGEFTKKWETAYINTATYVEYTGIEFEAKLQSVYGPGITVLPEMRNGQAVFTVKDVVITEGENAGKTYVRLDRTGNGGRHDLTISAKSEAGLLANTEYQVSVSVKCDGGDVPAYYDDGNFTFMFDQAGGNIVFTITTDGNGEFTKKWETAYINTATYVEYTGITIIPVN